MIAGLLCLILSSAAAQDTGSVEGRVTSSTTHQGIGGVAVSAGSQRAFTDPSGAYRLSGMAPGEAVIDFAAADYFKGGAKAQVAASGTPAHADIELVPHSSISGRVTDDEGHPLHTIRVDITQAVRGTGTTRYQWQATTNLQGRFQMNGMQPGTYLVMASPPRYEPVDGRMPVRTYYPGVRERSQAVRLTLRGGTTAVADIRILRAPVFAIKGRVYDDDGKPVNAYLRLLPSEILEDAEAIATAIDGVFEFRDVPAGDWRVSATFEGGGKRLSGSASVLLGRHDVENFAIRLAAPFSLSASVEPADSIKDPGLELFPVDAPPTLAAFARAGAEGKAEFPRVYPGRYRVNVYAEIPDHYLDSILIGSEEVLGKDATFAECMPPVRVIFKPNAAGIRGAIENCGIAQVLLLPHEEGLWNYRFIKRAGCDATGHFTISGLRPGEYYVLGLDRIDPTGLDDLPTLRRLASMASHVQIDPGRITYLDLKIQSWPE